MATLSIYHDIRNKNTDAPAQLKIAIRHKSQTAYIGLGIRVLPSQWNQNKCKVESHPNKDALNAVLSSKLYDYENAMNEMRLSGKLFNLSALQIRDLLVKQVTYGDCNAQFYEVANAFVDAKNKERTKAIYRTTIRMMQRYTPQELNFSDITYKWLTDFNRFLALNSPSANARAIHLRNIRAIFNYAIDNELASNYPFRKFKIETTATPKRSLSVQQLRQLFNHPVEDYQRIHLDMFKLIFFLIGINISDLLNLKSITPDGRVEYIRAKTGKLYSIKVEPEAMTIINRYKGRDYLLSPHDKYTNTHNYTQHLNEALQRIGEVSIGDYGKKTIRPLFPNITTYWARHSWATIASQLDIPKETIARALGHGGNTITDIYIDFDMKKVDEANRRVIDYVLYGKGE